MRDDPPDQAPPPSEPRVLELLDEPSHFPLAQRGGRQGPTQLVSPWRPLGTARAEMNLAVDPDRWPRYLETEQRDYSLSPQLYRDLGERVPQALLRDLHRPVLEFGLVLNELREGSEWQHHDQALTEIHGDLERKPLPRIEPLSRFMREASERRRALYEEPWRPLRPDDAQRQPARPDGGIADFFRRT